MKHHIAIAGNIGAGKTNLAKKLAEHFDWELFQEPFQENPYLENYYQDMGKWAFHCEMFFLSRRLKDQLAIIKNEKSILQDRCLYEGAEVFVKNLFLNNHLDEHAWSTYNNIYQSLVTLMPAPNLIIYLRSSTDRCFNNLNKRNRGLEAGIEKNYLADLNKLYEEWISNFKLCPIIIADGDANDFKYNDCDFTRLSEQIATALK